MAKREQRVPFTFINPDTADAFERAFRTILIDKLVLQHRQGRLTAA